MTGFHCLLIGADNLEERILTILLQCQEVNAVIDPKVLCDRPWGLTCWVFCNPDSTMSALKTSHCPSGMVKSLSIVSSTQALWGPVPTAFALSSLMHSSFFLEYSCLHTFICPSLFYLSYLSLNTSCSEKPSGLSTLKQE